jgi:hypothetical protein
MKVKIVLKRKPMDPENGIWVDGVRLAGVSKVDVHGGVGEIPYITVKLLPQQLELNLEDPDMKTES